MILALLLSLRALACEPLSAPPESFQVAWVSRLNRGVRAETWLEVVRVSELRNWIRERGKDPVRLLQALGMAARKPHGRARKPHKVTIFDVKGEWLCRPMEGRNPGEMVSGVAVCERSQQGRRCGHGRGYTGCGYTLDTGGSIRGLDVYRVQWKTASAWGFCVLPLDRFLEGA